MQAINRRFTTTLGALAFVMAVPSAWAAELKPGDMINAANFDKIKNDTFEGHTIADLVTEKMEFMIKKYNLNIKLRKSEAIPINQADIENTKKYAGDVKFDPKTNEVTGYKAGLPFPNLDMNDPKAGFKALYNHYYHGTIGNSFDGPYTFFFTSADKGVERIQSWRTITLKMKGRVTGDPVWGDGTQVSKQLLFATAPFDIKGIGILTVRHDGPQLEDNWAYIKSVRRTRQLSGGSWMDNLAGSVQLNDEYDIISARPSWFPEAKIVRKRMVLAVAHHKLPNVDASKKGTPAEYPGVDMKNKPHWNPIAEWEPREVWEIELKMPQEHPYSRRVLYMDTKFPRIWMGEHYDKSGQFVKIAYVLTTPIKGENGYVGMMAQQLHNMDIRRNEALVVLAHPDTITNRPNLKSDEVTMTKLEAAAK
ncbi:MAG: outer rane lipoproteinsorting protein [Massilia sp.]|nr:outer rane lipoproteinsorting protein [Massilia sp.]MDB5953031.1 outer rane lipoproteinsorting protein [Massilia sp.]